MLRYIYDTWMSPTMAGLWNIIVYCTFISGPNINTKYHDKGKSLKYACPCIPAKMAHEFLNSEFELWGGRENGSSFEVIMGEFYVGLL